MVRDETPFRTSQRRRQRAIMIGLIVLAAIVLALAIASSAHAAPARWIDEPPAARRPFTLRCRQASMPGGMYYTTHCTLLRNR